MLERARIRGYKCLRDVTVDLAPMTVLIGKNDAGKSSFLEALSVLPGLVFRTEPHRAQLLARSVSGGQGTMSWSLEYGPSASTGLKGPARYDLELRVDAEGFAIEREAAETQGVTQFETRPKANSHDGFLRRTQPDGTLRETANWQNVEDPVLVGIAQQAGGSDLALLPKLIRDVALHALEPSALATVTPLPDPALGEPTLDWDGRGLSSLLDHLLGERREQFDAIVRDIRHAAPFVRGVSLRTTRIDTVAGGTEPAKYISFDLPDGSRMNASEASHGVLLMLAYLTLMHAGPGRRLVLLEEPENGIHPRRLPEVAGYLRHITSPRTNGHQAQVVLTTHSPYFLDLVEPECVRVFGRRRSDGATVVRPISALPRVKEWINAGMSLGEMWFNVGEDELLEDLLQ